MDSVASLADVDVVNPDEKSIMTYVAQFLQYSKDVAATGDKAQVRPSLEVWLKRIFVVPYSWLNF